MAKQVSKKWIKNKSFKKPFDYHLEDSDQDVTVHRLDMPDLLKLGIANEMDFMSSALMSNPQADEAKAREAVADAAKKAGNFERMEIMINKVCMAGVIEPRLFPVPLKSVSVDGVIKEVVDDEARSEELMYIDEVPWDDRMELFSVIFETEGLSDFREEQEPGVGNVEHVQDVQLPADGPVADVRPSEPERVLSE